MLFFSWKWKHTHGHLYSKIVLFIRPWEKWGCMFTPSKNVAQTCPSCLLTTLMVIHWLKAFTIPRQHTFCITRTLEKVLPQPATTTSRLVSLPCLCINKETEMSSGVLFCYEPGTQFTFHCPCTAWICAVQLDWHTRLVYQSELYLGCKLCNVGLALEWGGERTRFMWFDCDLKKVQAWQQIPLSAQVLATYEQVE